MIKQNKASRIVCLAMSAVCLVRGQTPEAAVAATRSLSLPARPASPGKAARKAREAVLQARFAAVRVLATANSAANAPAWVDCWAVEAIETQPPKGCDALHWRLLTTWPVHGAEQALEVLRYYGLRWQIEVMHKVLKSGLGIERRARRTGQRLEWPVASACASSLPRRAVTSSSLGARPV